MDIDRKIRVFISYSWDSDDHKKWVINFASQLVDADFDVVLDEWDTDYGDDLTMFMEKSVREADRVLMVCTDQYVRKADEGKGGVGYESRIVTGELVRNLGEKKFVPVIREGTGEFLTPRFLSTRKFIDFREDKKFGIAIKELVESLKKTTISSKPVSAIPISENSVSIPVIATPEDLYSKAAELATTNNIMGWRNLVRDQKKGFKSELLAWREERDRSPPKTKDDLFIIADEVVEIASPLMIMALVGVQSTNDKFNDQKSLIDELSRPHEWNTAGLHVLAKMPETIGFVYQALHGAICMQSQQPELAMLLATASISYGNKTTPLFLDLRLTGWSDSLGGNTFDSWKYLYEAYSRWPWLSNFFADELEYRTCLVAYYMALNFIEFVDALSSQQQLKPGGLTLCVPAFFLDAEDIVCQRALRLVAQASPVFIKIAEQWNVSRNEIVVKWPEWIAVCDAWGSGKRKIFPTPNPMTSFMQNIGWAAPKRQMAN